LLVETEEEERGQQPPEESWRSIAERQQQEGK